MTMPDLSNENIVSTPENLGVEFAVSADGFPVARVGDMVLAMVSSRDGGHVLASTWRERRPLSDLKRDDFYIYMTTLAGEAEFRQRAEETAEHKRDLARLGRREIRAACSTPWGASQYAERYADGIVRYSTAGHGGFHLSSDRNAEVDPYLRNIAGWYEEDCEWAIVAFSFPDLFTSYERSGADRTLRDWWPNEWEIIHGRHLAPGESHRKDQHAFEEKHACDWVVISALLSNDHPGMTEVIATLGGKRDHHAEERRFLVPSAEYSTRAPFGFVIDEARHQPYEGPSSFAVWQARRMTP